MQARYNGHHGCGSKSAIITMISFPYRIWRLQIFEGRVKCTPTALSA